MMNPLLPAVAIADDDDDNSSSGRVVELATMSSSSSSIIRNRSPGNTNPQQQQKQQQHLPAPQSGHIPSPASGIRSLSDDGVNHRILSSPLLRHRHHHQQHHHNNRRQQSSGSSGANTATNNNMQHRRQQQQQFSTLIQGSHSLDDADIAAGAAQLRAMELLSSPTTTNHHHNHHHHSSGGTSTSRSSWVSSPSSRSLGSNTPTSFASFSIRQSSYSDGVERSNGPSFVQRMERGSDAAGHHYFYGGSEHDFLGLPPDDAEDYDDEDDDDTYDYEDRRQQQQLRQEQLLQQQHQHLRDHQYPPYGLPNIEGSPDIAAINNRRQKIQLSSSVDANGNNNVNDAEYFTALLPPLLSASAETTASPSNANATTTTTSSSSAKFAVLGWDLTTYTRRSQFLISAGGTFLFSLIYGYLQELISVSLCNRKLGLFLALAQFTGYTILSYFFRRLDMSGGGGGGSGGGGGAGASIGGGGGSGTSFFSRKFRRLNNWGKLRGGGTSSSSSSSSDPSTLSKKSIPIELYIGLSVLRAIDLGMTNLAMQYVNYPAKTIMKSTRVVWTMLFGVIVSKKRYGMADFGIVGLMVAGLGMFMHADAHTSAVFQPIGIIMLIISLLGDGAISNLSEALMNQYEVGQDEFIFRLYSIATFFICIAAAAKGDLRDGLAYLTRPGTMKEIEDDLVPTWSVLAKIMTLVLFSTTGFLGSSCSAAITKSFGALTMSITSTARKATTIFLSFALFPSNKCTLEHIGGILLFIASLVAKSVRESRRGRHHHHQHHNQQFHHHSPMKNQHSHTMGNGGMLPPVIMEIVNMSGGRNASRKNKTSPMGSSPLQLRHKVSGEDAV